jgi:hypothetical protein
LKVKEEAAGGKEISDIRKIGQKDGTATKPMGDTDPYKNNPHKPVIITFTAVGTSNLTEGM